MNEKINTVFQKLNEESKIEWQDKRNGIFLLKNKNKLVSGLISINENSIITTIKSTNYNHKYIQSKLNKLFYEEHIKKNSFTNDFISYSSGDAIRTMEHADKYNSGDKIKLPYDTKCYSRNDSVIKCDPVFVGSNIRVKYLNTEENKCLGGLNTSRYAILKIL